MFTVELQKCLIGSHCVYIRNWMCILLAFICLSTFPNLVIFKCCCTSHTGGSSERKEAGILFHAEIEHTVLQVLHSVFFMWSKVSESAHIYLPGKRDNAAKHVSHVLLMCVFGADSHLFKSVPCDVCEWCEDTQTTFIFFLGYYKLP